MTQDWPFLELPVRPVTLILQRLRASWPDTVTLTATDVGLAGDDRAFVRTVVALQDHGWLMFEAMLVGVGPEPYVVDAVLTAKGMKQLEVMAG